ncbi:hypothetical protein [Nocardiopsis alkaliphila]|uniref:hypothetical protein n=1 Tax=Nocardiopsis alkaliphila TaxID=225762 RepID=UPI000346D99C|nr:hypothetical protein [Nocardiopsis alkaliphila]
MSRHTDALVERLTRLLNDPGRPEEAVTRLISADAVFDRLDRALRSGGDLPTPWDTRLGDGMETMEVTEHYDALSEALRETGEPLTCRRALSRARYRWASLRIAITSGAPLPQPWERR